MSDDKHIPVMLPEVIEALHVMPGKWYVDATFGRGGYTEAILDEGGQVIAFDHDATAIAYGQAHFKYELAHNKLVLIRENFAKLGSVITDLKKRSNITEIQGIVYDFGTSSEQLTNEARGFSFSGSGPLDMRMDDRLGVTAADLLNALPEKQLAELFREKGGEHASRPIAKAIVKARTEQPITTTDQLVKIITKVVGAQTKKLHPATKVFQALRMAVNDEETNIEISLPQALTVVKAAGTIVTVAFHQGEDALAKHIFKQAEQANVGTTTGPLTPTETEIITNQRARSAKLRIFRKAA